MRRARRPPAKGAFISWLCKPARSLALPIEYFRHARNRVDGKARSLDRDHTVRFTELGAVFGTVKFARLSTESSKDFLKISNLESAPGLANNPDTSRKSLILLKKSLPLFPLDCTWRAEPLCRGALSELSGTDTVSNTVRSRSFSRGPKRGGHSILPPNNIGIFCYLPRARS